MKKDFLDQNPLTPGEDSKGWIPIWIAGIIIATILFLFLLGITHTICLTFKLHIAKSWQYWITAIGVVVTAVAIIVRSILRHPRKTKT